MGMPHDSAPHGIIRGRIVLAGLAGLLALSVTSTPVLAQTSEFTLSPGRDWSPTTGVATDDPRAIPIQEARRHLAEDNPKEARRLLDDWLEQYSRIESPLVAEAYLLRGDARTATDDEFRALYDYEAVINKFPESDEFRLAVARELDIAIAYLNGRKLKQWGLRWFDPEDIAIEILVRVNERLPGSQLAERAVIEMADYYYRRRDVELARDSYEMYLSNFAQGPNRMKAAERRIYCDIARFKGPRYNAAGLINAKERIKDFADRYPLQAQRTGINEALTTRLDESMAAQLLDISDWYRDRGDWASQRHTLRRLLKAHPRTIAGERALEILQKQGWLEAAVPAADPDAAPTANDAAPEP